MKDLLHIIFVTVLTLASIGVLAFFLYGFKIIIRFVYEYVYKDNKLFGILIYIGLTSFVLVYVLLILDKLKCIKL